MLVSLRIHLPLIVSLMLVACSPPPKKPGVGDINSKSGMHGEGPPDGDGTGENEDARDSDNPAGDKEGGKTGSGGVKESPKSTAEGVEAVIKEGPSDCDEKTNLAGRKSLRLLTKAEYFNTVRDVLKVANDPTGLLPVESSFNGFLNNVDSNVIGPDRLTGYIEIAISIADELKPKLSTLVGCSEDAGETCAQKVIDTIAPKLYRRPLTQAEKTFALSTFKKGFLVAPREGMTLLIASLLTSPSFLYRSEIGNSTGDLDAYEIASALSYFFWGTVPDEALNALAASGKLATPAIMVAEAQRLWKDKKSRFVTDQFAHSWLENQSILNASKDPSLTKIFTPEIQKAMMEEAQDTFDYLIRQTSATFESLYASDFTIGPPSLAAFYKGQSVVEGTVTKIKFPGTPRKGLVTLGAVTAGHSAPNQTHPIKRGDFILQKMLCFVPPPTPEGLNVEVPNPDPTKTTRQRFSAHSTNPACAGCHIKIDGIGFGMEDYDTLGVYRPMENGMKVDASGTMVDVDGKNIKFNGGGNLAEEMAKTSQAKRCFSLQWYRYTHGRTMVASDPDICATRHIASKFASGEISVGDLLIKIITDPSYTRRDH